MIPAANKQRVISEFTELVSFDSESLNERQIADALKIKLKDIGCTVEEDDAAGRIKGTSGNLLAKLDGVGEPLLLMAHMDTVSPGKGKEARIINEDGISKIIGNGSAVLGADDVTGIVEILEGLRILKENNIPHRPVEILFTVSEESFGRGIKAFDISKIESKEAYVFDLAGPVGSAAVRAPSLIMIRIKVMGRAAHAGFDPNSGINAIEIVSRSIAKLRQGQIDEETTFNIGKIEGGIATNIVPDLCRVIGEVRSYDHEKAEDIAANAEEIFRDEAASAGAAIDVKKSSLIRAYTVDTGSKVCRNFERALDMAGIKGFGNDTDTIFNGADSHFVSTFGGSDNNVLAERGLEGIVLSSGMYDVHSVKEYATVEDLEVGAKLAAALCI